MSPIGLSRTLRVIMHLGLVEFIVKLGQAYSLCFPQMSFLHYPTIDTDKINIVRITDEHVR